MGIGSDDLSSDVESAMKIALIQSHVHQRAIGITQRALILMVWKPKEYLRELSDCTKEIEKHYFIKETSQFT